METVLSPFGITLIYIVLLGIGIIYALVILLGAGLHDIHIPGLDLHIGGHDFSIGHDVSVGHDASFGGTDIGSSVDHPSVKVPSLSPITVASFVTAFGAFGLVALGIFSASTRASLLWAAIGGTIVALIAHFAFGYFLIAPQGSSEVKLKELVGVDAEVITPIPGDSVGEIAFVAQGGRVTYTAKSADNTPIPRGALVKIQKIIGGVAIVQIQNTQNKA